MAKEEHEIPSYFRNKVAFSIGTLQRSDERVEAQKRIQKGSVQTYFDIIKFDNGPLPFNSIVFLPPGDCVHLNVDEKALHRFRSRTKVALCESDLKVFARVVLDDGGRRCIPLSLMDNTERMWLAFVYEIDEDTEDTTTLVDALLIAGSFETASYILLRHKDATESWTNIPDTGDSMYYGNNVLDTIDNNEAVPAAKSVVKMEIPESTNGHPDDLLYQLRQYTVDAQLKTLFEVREVCASKNHEESKIKHLVERLNSFVEVEGDVNDYDDLEDCLMDCYRYTKFIFSDKIPLEECIIPVVKKCIENMSFDYENVYYIVLRTMIRDCDVAYRLMFDMGFGNVLIEKLIDTESKRWIQREVMLNLLTEILAHGKCMRNFIRNDLTGKGESLCDMLIMGIAKLRMFSLGNMKQYLEDIGKRVELFLVLSRVEQMYDKLEPKLKKTDESQYGHLETLVQAINEAIDMVKLHQVGNMGHSGLTDISKIKQYTVSYVMETRLPFVVTGVMAALLSHLEGFPVSPLHIGVMLERPLWLVSHYINLVDFEECLFHMEGVCNFAGGMVINNVVKNDKYANSRITYCKKQCERMIIHTIMLKMIAKLFGNTSCPQIVSVIYRVCRNYSCGYKVMATILAEENVIQEILYIVTSAIKNVQSSGFNSTGPKDNMELWQLINIICTTVIKDESGMLLYVLGKKLISPLSEFLEAFQPQVSAIVDLDLQPICDLHDTLKRLFNSSALKGGSQDKRYFESVELYLSDLLIDSGVELRPDMMKQNYSKALHMNTMSLVSDKMPNSVFLMDPLLCKTMTKSMLTEELGTVYNQSEAHVEIGGVYWSSNENCVIKGSELGVSEDKMNHYRTCELYVAPPDRLPEYVTYGITLLRFASTMEEYSSVFTEMFQTRENTKTFLRLWVHTAASICPTVDTLINAEIGVFNASLGYEWFFSSADAIPMVTNMAQIMYAVLHHISGDPYCHEDTNEQRPVTSAPLRYINDDVLDLVLVSVCNVMITKRWSVEGQLGRASRKCLIWLTKLMSYWYRRFQKSQGYLMNKLMGSYTSIPFMADGAALLIVACGPVINPNAAVEIHPQADSTDHLGLDHRTVRVHFEGQLYNVSLSGNEVTLDDVPNAAFWGLIRRIESLNLPIFADFMCTVVSRCYATNPCTVVLASEIINFLIIGNVPIMELVNTLTKNCLEDCIKGGTDANRSGNISATAYRLLTFASLLAKAVVSNENIEPSILVRVNYWILNLFSHYAKNFKSLAEGCYKALFEGYVHIFICHNNLWENHNSVVTRHPEFNNYIKHINGAVYWICNALNGCRAKDTENPDDGSHNQKMNPVDYDDCSRIDGTLNVSWETILTGVMALKYAFEMPFTALNILYTVLSGPMELIVKIINKQIDSEIIKVTPSATLALYGIVRQLCEALQQHNIDDMSPGSLPSDATLQLLIMQLIHDICASIHQTGASQDVFVCALIHGTSHSQEVDMITNENRVNPTDGAQSLPHDDIYSDIVGSSKTRNQRKVLALSTPKVAIDSMNVFQGIMDALKVFRDNAATALEHEYIGAMDRVALSSQIANVLLLLNAFDALSRAIARDAAERTPPKSLPGYLFLKAPSYSRLFRQAIGDTWSTSWCNRNSTRSILQRVLRMMKCDDYETNTCMVLQHVPSPLSTDNRMDVQWLSKCFMYNGSPESVQMWKTIRFLATSKLLFADELKQYDPIKTKKIDRPHPNEGTRYLRSVSTRAPSKHVDAYESEKTGAPDEEEECTFSQENIEKAVAQLNGVITSQTWLDFDNDLVTNGLNLRSVLVNPGILKEYSARATFLNALSRHVLIKELLISVGVDVR